MLAVGSTVRATGRGFLPGSTVRIWVFSSARLLGTTKVRANGTFSVMLPVPTTLRVGDHTVQAVGRTQARTRRALNLGVRVARVSRAEISSFAQGTATLSPALKSQIRTVASLVKSQAARSVALVGFTDGTGSATDNSALSLTRAQNAGAYLAALLKGLGAKSVRITCAGLGAARPVATNATEGGRARNRRVEVTLGFARS